MDKLNKLQKTISIMTHQYNSLLRKMEIIPLASDTGKNIVDLWNEHTEEYGDIKYILGYSLETTNFENSENSEKSEASDTSSISTNSLDIIKNKYHIICFKNQNPKNINYYYTTWCIQINN